jgi:translation initiation factor IF-1
VTAPPGDPAAAAAGQSRAIAFDGEIVSLLPLGVRRVRLDNGHLVTVLPSFGRAVDVPLVGDRVVVEITFNQLKGWRLARRP